MDEADRAVRVTVVRTEDLDTTRRAEIIEVCVAAHASEAFRDLFTFIPSGGRHVLVHHGDELLSHAVVQTRWLQPGDGPALRTAWFDAVSTRPDRQGRGYGRAAMVRLGETIDDYEIGGLQTDLRGFYEPLGWQLWRGPLAGRSDDGLIPTPDQEGVMVLSLPATPVLNLDAPLSVECQPDRIWE
jgi:GNAT superfamily N-acetyltransferase